MGLFGAKKSNAQKNYEYAYKKFPSKKVGVTELEEAIAAVESDNIAQVEIWKAHFKIAIALDCGQIVAMDEEAAKPHHEKVRAMIDISDDARLKEWADTFYYWYNQSGINWISPIDRQTENIRRLGNALMNVVGITGNGCMVKEIKQALDNLWFYNNGLVSQTAESFLDYARACTFSLSETGEIINKNIPQYKDENSENIEKFYNRAKEEKNRSNNDPKKTDLHEYILGFQYVHRSPLCFLYTLNVKNPTRAYVVRLVNATFAGNSMALHKLVLFANNSEPDHKSVADICEISEGALDMLFIETLQKCEKAGDYTATELLNQYYASEI